jgi:Major capsid protein Gp23
LPHVGFICDYVESLMPGSWPQPLRRHETCIAKVLSSSEDSDLAQAWNPNMLVADSAMGLPCSLTYSCGSARKSDLLAYHGLNAENELMTAIADEITREIDREIINALFAFAGAGNTNWTSTVPISGPFASQPPKIYNETIFEAIVEANANIKKKRYRNATWIVCGTNTATRLEKLNSFRLFPAGDPTGTIVQGPNLFGTLSGRWTVYVDPWLDDTLPGGAEQMLLGYKGNSAMDTGFVTAAIPI